MTSGGALSRRLVLNAHSRNAVRKGRAPTPGGIPPNRAVVVIMSVDGVLAVVRENSRPLSVDELDGKVVPTRRRGHWRVLVRQAGRHVERDAMVRCGHQLRTESVGQGKRLERFSVLLPVDGPSHPI